MSDNSLNTSTLSGIRWLAVRSVVGEFVTVATTVTLAHLLSPSQFGHAAVATAFLPLAVILTFEGFGSALVQRNEVNDRHREVAVALSLGVGTLLAVAVGLFGVFICPAFFGEQTGLLIALTAPGFFLAGIGCVSRATMWRQLAFNRMTQIDLAAGFFASVTSVVLAVLGVGAASLVLGGIVAIAMTSVLQMILAPEPRPRWHRNEAREIARFGGPASGHALVTQLFGNIDYLIVAARLSAFQTGIYYRAFNLGVVYQSKVSNVMLMVSFPVYSRMTSRQEMRSLYERAARLHAVVIFPLLTLLIVAAPVLIPFAFGAPWTDAVVPTQILAVAGMITAVLTGYPQLLNACGQPQAVLKFKLAMLGIYATAIVLAVDHGVTAVAIADVAVYVIMLLGVYQGLLKPLFGLAFTSLIREMTPPIIACAVLVAATEPLRLFLSDHVPAVVTLVAIGLAGVAAYATVLRLAFRQAWADLALVLDRMLPAVAKRRRHGETLPVPGSGAVGAGSLDPAESESVRDRSSVV